MASRQGAGMIFRKKPLTIEAQQITEDNFAAICEWVNAKRDVLVSPIASIVGFTNREEMFCGTGLTIRTLEGLMFAGVGHWIVKGVNGEFYPVKDDIFVKTYEAID
jgi:hypothetical protein